VTSYLLDTNAVSDLIANQSSVIRHLAEHLATDDQVGLCRPVHYEILRGLFWRGATSKIHTYTQRIIPLLTWIELTDLDWEEAARLWADARRRGRQLGDPDLLLAAIAHKETMVLVSSDADFDTFSVTREDWRI